MPTTKSGSQSVAVMVVNWNTAALLQDCLKSLESLPENDELEIVVIDNASSDDSVEVVREFFPDVKLLENATNEGFARANNQGVCCSTSPYILLLNSDTIVEPGAIANARDYLAAHDDVGAVGCRIINLDGTVQSSVFRDPSLRGVVGVALGLSQLFPNSEWMNADRYGRADPTVPTSVEVIMGSFFMVRRNDFADEDLLDEGFFMYAEEADLCRRIRERGQQVHFLPIPGALHIAGASTRSAAQRAWSDEAKKRAQLRFIKKWSGLPAAYITNLVMTIGMVPRVAVWAVADGLAVLRGGAHGRLLRARAGRFHLAVIVRPDFIGRRFHGPPVQ